MFFISHPKLHNFYYQKIQILISAFDAQGSRGIIVPVQVGAVKIYVAAMEEVLRKKERQGETQKTIT